MDTDLQRKYDAIPQQIKDCFKKVVQNYELLDQHELELATNPASSTDLAWVKKETARAEAECVLRDELKAAGVTEEQWGIICDTLSSMSPKP